MVHNDKGLWISVSNPVVTNEGASYGPRVGTVTFEARRGARWRATATLWADFDGREWQDEPLQKRKGAQAVVPIGRRTAAAIAEGVLEPIFERQSGSGGWVSVVFRGEDVTDGCARRARVEDSFVWDEDSWPPQLPAGLAERLAKMLRDLADALHAGVHDERNREVFGVWKSVVSRPRPL